ncbi:undecaprenyl-diphosphate phosphatase [Porphyromonas sp.]|uniref:undecaprenyl-diphosphate phosphatase n=1 Tax=Porphyromonas sp. TaxID=1924944 RepID=UPI0026DCE153|nr:undecaprenyl-diphosphate phosphatase [Porphyromonas sp.]MDO4695488.1 undecaprenyl-diphosphate phosphatase [Porphyromonas sp.]MDO4770278.1 undecaprenyl-diphosphate phosphatase [Porphyromonas sp.]
MSILEAIILAIVEGLTEFLPISSTGHMIITQALMGMESTEYVKSFTVMIQLGAILSVVVLYFKRFINFSLPSDMWHGNIPEWRRFLARFRFYFKLIVGLIPAVIFGLIFNNWIDEVLGSVWVIAVNLIIGGIVMLFVDSIIRNNERSEVTYPNAIIIGFFQCLAILLPGMSRSMCTIVGGMTQGLTRKTAAEFSFFLAVPTMFGAALLKAYKMWESGGKQIFVDNLNTLIIGNVVSFIVGLLAIKFFISYLGKHGFRAFGIYRILVGGTIITMILLGVDLAVI